MSLYTSPWWPLNDDLCASGRECSRSMNEQQASPSRTILVVSLFLVVAAAALAASLYYFDGVRLLTDFASTQWARITGDAGADASPAAVATSTPDPGSATRLVLPAGMPESFALRLWQEQVDSQEIIGYLAKGEIKSLSIDSTDTVGDESTLGVTVRLADGTKVPGRIVMRRFDGAWYVASASRAENIGTAVTALPKVEEVDVPLLNTLVAEQLKNKVATQEYVDGHVLRVNLGKPEPGDRTIRIPAAMAEDHTGGYADIVLVSYADKVSGGDLWFIARFAKAGTQPVQK